VTARVPVSEIRVRHVAGRTDIEVDEWLAADIPSGLHIVDSGHLGKYEPDWRSLPKGARESAQDRGAYGGADKGRVWGLYRAKPLNLAHYDTLGILCLHLDPPRPPLITKIDLAATGGDEALQNLWRQLFVNCLDQVMPRLPWQPTRMELRARNEAEAKKLLSGVAGLRRYRMKEIVRRAIRGEIRLYRDRPQPVSRSAASSARNS
jgi:hypothetical protein